MSQTKIASVSNSRRYRKARPPNCEVLTSNLLVLVVAILNSGEIDGGLVGEDQAALLQVTVTGVQDSIQHRLVEKEITHPLGDDNINLRERKFNLLHLSLDQGDLIGEAIDLDDLAGLENNG